MSSEKIDSLPFPLTKSRPSAPSNLLPVSFRSCSLYLVFVFASIRTKISLAGTVATVLSRDEMYLAFSPPCRVLRGRFN